MRNRSRTWAQGFLFAMVAFLVVFSPLAASRALARPVYQEPEPQYPQESLEPLAPLAPGDHLVTNLIFGPDTPNILRNNDHVTLNLKYSTTQADGVRLWAMPYSNGAFSPGGGYEPSPILPAATDGSVSRFFTINSGNVVVDQVRILMTNSTQTATLFETFIPVHYQFTDSPHAVTHISLTPDTPDALKFGQDVSLRFNYLTRQPDGVLIYARPFTNGALTPNFSAHASGLYPTGSGQGTGDFTIKSNQVVVDQIRIQIVNSDQTLLLFEAFLPVYYRFRDPTNIVTHIEFSPDTPNVFKYGQKANLTFSYTTNHAAGVLIFARPFSGPNPSPGYSAHGSSVYPVGSGAGSGWFTLNSGPMVVDKVRIQMLNPEQTVLLYEGFFPVHLFWAGLGPPPGPDMSVNSIEVTQAIQDLNNSVDLVAGKRTYVRVHASSPANINDVFATLSGRRGFITLTPTLNPGNPGSDILVRTSPDRGQINDSFWFELPSGWTGAGNLTLTARLDPNNAKNDLNLANNVKSVTVNFKSTPPLRLRIMNVQYTSGGNTFLESSSHLASLESWLRRAYPISSLQVNRQTFVYPTGGLPDVDQLHVWLALAKLLRIIFNGEDTRTVYYGVVDDGGGFMRGKAAGIPGSIAAGPSGSSDWGWDFDGSYNDWYGGHEIGHTRNRYHAEFCGAGGGVAYPYPGGRISPDLTGSGAIYGFDITTRAIYGPSWKDVMTYCDNQWVSDFTYEGIRSYIAGQGFGPEPASVTASEFLVVAGMADLESSTASLQNVYQIQNDATLPLPEPGDWSIVLRSAADEALAAYPFAPDPLSDAEDSPGEPAVIAEVVPWTPGAVKVEIRYQDQLKASRSASANAPSVDLTAPAGGANLPAGPFQVTWNGSDPDGDALRYSLLFSSDGGSSWETLATDLETTSLGLHTDQLPGGSVMLRVVASDGFLSTFDTGAAFTLPQHAPEVEILDPADGEVFFPAQPVTLQGSAYDLEDGSPEEAAYQWSSSIDGALGSGSTLNTAELTAGAHVLTLQVIDSDGMSGQAQVSITIAAEDVPEAVDLVLAPFAVVSTVAFGSGPVQEPLTLRSSGETELDWTASENVPWLTLSAASGQSPADLALTINPAGLSVGSHVGKITFTSPQAASGAVEVYVNLTVTGVGLYMPVVTR